MTINSEKEGTMNFATLETQFFNLLDKLEIYDNNSDILSLSIQLKQIAEQWLGFHISTTFDHLIDKEKVKQLESIINKYPQIQNEYKNIIDAYTFKKPTTSMELYNIPIQQVFDILRDLESFFFVAHVPFRGTS